MNNASISSLDAFVDVLTNIERESGSTPLITVVTKKVLSKKKMNSSMNSRCLKRTENNKREEEETKTIGKSSMVAKEKSFKTFRRF